MGNNGNAGEFLEAAKDIKIKAFAENILITEVDKFVEQHLDNKPIEKQEIENFYSTLLDKCVENGLISEKAREEYKKPTVKGVFGMKKEASEFEKIVQATSELLKDTTPALSRKEKLFYNVAQFCEDLGLKSFAAIFKNQISSDNQKKLDKIYTALASDINTMQPAAGKHVTAVIEGRKYSQSERTK